MLFSPLDFIVIILWYTPNEVIGECRQLRRITVAVIASAIVHRLHHRPLESEPCDVPRCWCPSSSALSTVPQWVDPNVNILFIVYLVLMLYLLFRVISASRPWACRC